jgi:Fe2+ transport system protein FeoA
LNLSDVPSGRRVRIDQVVDDKVRAHLLRLGIVEGCRVECVHGTAGGAVVIRKSNLELSLGHRVARGILVSLEEDGQ